MQYKERIFSPGNSLLLLLYLLLVFVGLVAIISVEHKPDMDFWENLFAFKTNYSRQFYFIMASLAVGGFILLTDAKFFATTANLLYLVGILLMLATFVVGKNVGGSRSWIPLGFMNLQPAETCKIFVALALAKFISSPETDFRKVKNHTIAVALALLPAVLSILQNETGLALVYFAFFIPLFREGLPPVYLIVGASAAIMVVLSVLVEPNLLATILTIIALAAAFFLRKKIQRNRSLLALIFIVWGICVGIQRFAVPFMFEKVMQPYQVERIMSMFGRDYVPRSEEAAAKLEMQKKRMGKISKTGEKQENYNVKQSKIAIGSGGFAGKGFLQGAVTQGDFVPEQHTDFIFTAIGESFGFLGTVFVVLLYLGLLILIIELAEQQRSTFSRIYGYGVASVIFFHMSVNVLMTIGLAPIIGIPLPFISYGGSSLLSFSVLIFIFMRLNASKNAIIR